MRTWTTGPCLPSGLRRATPLVLALALGGCAYKEATAPRGVAFQNNPCQTSGTLSIPVATATRVDCSNGGTIVVFEGGGASYLIVPQLPTNAVTLQLVPYSLASGTLAAALAAERSRGAAMAGAPTAPPADAGLRVRPSVAQQQADALLRRSGRRLAASPAFRATLVRAPGPLAAAVNPPPPPGSVRSFHVRSSFSSATWATVGAQLAYVGANVLLYVDTLAPANGFTSAQLQSYGQLFDQTLYPTDTTAFGPPSDIDNNGRVIMLMSPVVNGDTPASTCSTSGYVAGFFDETDFDGPSDPNSNQGEIFYSIVPDPNGAFSCAHTVSDVDFSVPAVFLHELQHLISFSRHVVVGGGDPESGWLDEGMSILAEELGSLYYEQKCPPPSCRTNSSQLFPDSSQGFIQDFLYDSYEYALVPDTASITLHTDADFGFSWRGGAWLLVRYLADQWGSGILKALENGPADGVVNIEAATGQTFPAVFSNFGIALYTDSLPGLPRSTAPPANRFVTRNLSQLWARLYTTSGGSLPRSAPVYLAPVSTDTTTAVLEPGTMTFFRLDTPSGAATVPVRFAGPGGTPVGAAFKPQLAIFRLPPGQ